MKHKVASPIPSENTIARSNAVSRIEGLITKQQIALKAGVHPSTIGCMLADGRMKAALSVPGRGHDTHYFYSDTVVPVAIQGRRKTGVEACLDEIVAGCAGCVHTGGVRCRIYVRPMDVFDSEAGRVCPTRKLKARK